MFFHFMESDEEIDGIMPPCAGKTQEQGDVSPEFRVITGQLEQGVAEVIFFEVTVPAPGSIGIREMAQVFGRAIPVMSARADMCMHGGAVPGNRKVFHWYEAAFHGRQDGGMIEEALQALFKVKRDIFPVHEAFFDGFGDFGLSLLSFLFFAFGLIGFFCVPGSGKQFIPCI